ncbi:hypothetical protein KC321_g16 [Hortaea werneckii]|nr:hypothetical protein KC321_g16 [Hortaea werneckii]
MSPHCGFSKALAVAPGSSCTPIWKYLLYENEQSQESRTTRSKEHRPPQGKEEASSPANLHLTTSNINTYRPFTPSPWPADLSQGYYAAYQSLLALLDMLSLFDRDIARAHLIHPDAHKRHESDLRIVRFDEDDSPGGDMAEIALAGGNTADVDLVDVRIPKAFEERLRKVCSVLDISFLNRAADGRVPAMVGKSRQERLVDDAAGEIVGQLVVSQHVQDRTLLSHAFAITSSFSGDATGRTSSLNCLALGSQLKKLSKLWLVP